MAAAARQNGVFKVDFAWLVTITGMTIVMLVLIGLVTIVSLLRLIFYRKPKEGVKKEPPKAAVKSAAPAPHTAVMSADGQAEDIDELIAVISAAAWLSSESGQSCTVRSVRHAGRPIWATKGIIDNVQPF